jgi:serine/threonine protein kinase
MWTLDKNNSIKSFTEDDIDRFTSGCSIPIGKGGFGEVYKGVLGDDCDLVAVKRYIRGDLREEFMEEVRIHSKIKHKNVVKLIGYCIGENTLTIVTEYVSGGNLDDALHKRNASIPLDIRLGIAIGCAEALSYMHSMHLSSDSLVCHGDVKPANILLDDNLMAKVTDFGLSRILWGGTSRYTSNVKGSIDYMDPIYLREGHLTPRNDVYSFGAVLLELITRRRVKQRNVSLIGTICSDYAKGSRSRKLFDAEITNSINVRILEELASLATECLNLDINKRPLMSDVAYRLRMLRKALLGWQGVGLWEKSIVGVSKRNCGISETLAKLSNVRVFTKDEMNQMTKITYSYKDDVGSPEVYKGILDDNTAVLVKVTSRAFRACTRKYLMNEGLILSQLAHENVMKLLGYCLEGDTPTFIYEYPAKGSLSDILHGEEDFPLYLRVKIAVKISEALEYLHSSTTGIIGLGNVKPSNIFLDDNLMPKLTDFSGACRLINESVTNNASESAITSCSLLVGFNKIRNDVYRFGVVLLALINKRYFRWDEEDSTIKKALFHIRAAEDITVLEEIGRLALKCIEENEETTMSEVAGRLRMLRKSWKKRTTS